MLRKVKTDLQFMYFDITSVLVQYCITVCYLNLVALNRDTSKATA